MINISVICTDCTKTSTSQNYTFTQQCNEQIHSKWWLWKICLGDVLHIFHVILHGRELSSFFPWWKVHSKSWTCRTTSSAACPTPPGGNVRNWRCWICHTIAWVTVCLLLWDREGEYICVLTRVFIFTTTGVYIF